MDKRTPFKKFQSSLSYALLIFIFKAPKDFFLAPFFAQGIKDLMRNKDIICNIPPFDENILEGGCEFVH